MGIVTGRCDHALSLAQASPADRRRTRAIRSTGKRLASGSRGCWVWSAWRRVRPPITVSATRNRRTDKRSAVHPTAGTTIKARISSSLVRFALRERRSSAQLYGSRQRRCRATNPDRPLTRKAAGTTIGARFARPGSSQCGSPKMSSRLSAVRTRPHQCDRVSMSAESIRARSAAEGGPSLAASS